MSVKPTPEENAAGLIAALEARAKVGDEKALEHLAGRVAGSHAISPPSFAWAAATEKVRVRHASVYAIPEIRARNPEGDWVVDSR